MKILKVITNACFIIFAFALIVSCEEEFNAIESSVLGEDNFNFNTPRTTIDILAYNANLEAQQINNLPSYLLGHFNDPVYGTTTASIVTQVAPTASTSNVPNTISGDNLQVESVILTLPFFSRQVDNQVQIDSLFVTNNAPQLSSSIKLSVYENTFFLRDFDPNSPSDTQTYHSNANSGTADNLALTSTNTINFDENTNTKLYENNDFNFVRDSIIITNTGVQKATIQVNLAATESLKQFWKTSILDADEAVLSNTDSFLNLFRGLYIKAEANGNDLDSNMAMVNFNDTDANITINYSRAIADSADREDDTFQLSFVGNRLNTFVNNYNTSVLPASSNTTDGDTNIYLKGTEGAMGVIELFDDENLIECNCGTNSQGQPIIVQATALDCFKKSFRKTDDEGNILPAVNGIFELKRFINEAQLLVYEDNSIITPMLDAKGDDFHAHDRLYIYDLENNAPIIDYVSDPTSDTNFPLLVRRNFSSGLRTTSTENGEQVSRYRLRLTDHLTNILVREASSPKLGLVLTNNIDITLTAPLLTPVNAVSAVTNNTIITPRGTVLVGSNVADSGNTSKRMRLEIFSTDPR